MGEASWLHPLFHSINNHKSNRRGIINTEVIQLRPPVKIINWNIQGNQVASGENRNAAEPQHQIIAARFYLREI